MTDSMRYAWRRMVVRDPYLSDAARRVLLELESYADPDGRNARPGRSKIAESLLTDSGHVSEKTVTRAINVGIQLGFVECTTKGRQGRMRNSANVYRLTFPVVEESGLGDTQMSHYPNETRGHSDVPQSDSTRGHSETTRGHLGSTKGHLDVPVPVPYTSSLTPDQSLSSVSNAYASAREEKEQEPVEAEVVEEKPRDELDPGFRAIFGSSLLKPTPAEDPILKAPEKQEPTWHPEPESEPEPLTPVEEVRRMRVDLSLDEEILAKELAALGHSKYEIVKEIDRARRRRKNHPLPRRAG